MLSLGYWVSGRAEREHAEAGEFLRRGHQFSAPHMEFAVTLARVTRWQCPEAPGDTGLATSVWEFLEQG